MGKYREFWISDSMLDFVDKQKASGVTAYKEKPETTYHKNPSTKFIEAKALAEKDELIDEYQMAVGTLSIRIEDLIHVLVDHNGEYDEPWLRSLEKETEQTLSKLKEARKQFNQGE